MSESVPAVSIVIPTFNEEHYSPKLLESLLAIQDKVDVIVADGDSSDRTVEAVTEFIPRFKAPSSLRVISAPRGISSQRNAGAYAAKNEILLFLDADVIIPSAEAYRALIHSFETSGCVAASAHLTPLERTVRGYLVYGFFDIVQSVFLRLRKPCFGTFCFITTRKVFDALGGFDVKKHVTEDIDFCNRAQELGNLCHLPVRIPVSERRFVKYGYWNVFWLYLKEGFLYLTIGAPRLKTIVYPFGEY